MGRIIVDLPDEDLRRLDAIKVARKKPRAEIIRMVISTYLENNCVCEEESAFGNWRMENGDGLAFQASLREEWHK